MPNSKTKRIALAGNPNCGKSTIFNLLTGEHQHTGNWPGKTVAHHSGYFKLQSQAIEIVDLPGAYSLHPFSLEERITRDYLALECPDLIINVLDASNLERNLYLTVQLLELNIPMVIVLNMWDEVNKSGIEIDLVLLSKVLHTPIISMVGRRGKGLKELHQLITEGLIEEPSQFKLVYPSAVEETLTHIETSLAKSPAVLSNLPPRWLAIKAIEGDSNFLSQHFSLALCHLAATYLHTIETNDDIDTLIANERYTWINQISKKIITHPPEKNTLFTEKIDALTTHPIVGIPIFLAIMWATFKITADVSAPYLDWINSVFTGPIPRWGTALIATLGLEGSWLHSLLVDGIITGVGGILVFIPVLAALYFVLAILEDTGYMARAAFVMDRLMSTIGLSGKSFLPMVVGFGCTVPAVYATRTLENQRDQVLTSLLVPFMSCGARLPVYVLFGSIFFPQHSGLLIFSLYLLGIVMAIITGLILSKSVYKTDVQTTYILELPKYRWPTAQSIWRRIRIQVGDFLKNAATIILLVSVSIWLLSAIPIRGTGKFANTKIENSAFALAGGLAGLTTQPLGFGGWENGGALLSGLVAKEVVVSSMAQIYGIDIHTTETQMPTFVEDLQEITFGFGTATLDTLKAIPSIIGINLSIDSEAENQSELINHITQGFFQSSGGHPQLAALAFLVFVLLYTPCMATLAALKQEFGWQTMWFSFIGQGSIAWLTAFAIFWGGKLIGLG